MGQIRVLEMRNTEERRGYFLFAVGPLPPPIQGAAVATEAIINYLRNHGAVQTANISPGTKPQILSKAIKSFRVALTILRLPAAALRHKERVLYMAADGGSGLLYNIAIAAVARLCGYRIFLHHHSFAYVDKSDPLMAILTRIMGVQSTHIVLGEAMAAGLRLRYPWMDHTTMIELSNAAFFSPPPLAAMRERSEIQIGFLSNLIIEKGLDTAIALLREALRQGLPVKLILAGGATNAHATEMVEEALAEFGASIEYLGHVSGQEKVDFYQSIDVFVFPSRYFNEAQPLAVLEALCFGAPVLTIARSCIANDIGDKAGLCVPRGSDFVANVLPLLRSWCQDKQALDQSRSQAYQRAIELHNKGKKQLEGLVCAFSFPPT